MSRRRILEGTWKCRSCDKDGILGRHKICPECGNPREDAETQFEFGDRPADVSAPELLDLADAGEDWFCVPCSASNRGDVARCHQCGAERGAPAAPPPVRRPPPSVRRPFPRGLLGCAAVPVLAAVVCCGVVSVNAWQRRPLEVEAAVTGRTWVREVRVERLAAEPSATWKDVLPAPAGVPGSGVPLREGLGAIDRCETRACWPRPPDGATFARVTGRSWSHAVETRRLVESRDEGWDEKVPRPRGVMPVRGEGGSEGVFGEPSCRSREREPRRCHTEQRQETCGTTEKCTRRDLGNGFAEEVCHDVPKTCTRSEEVCTEAVDDRFCTWTTLSWAPGRKAERHGTLDAPAWPALTPANDEAMTRTATYRVALESLAGPNRAEFHPTTPEALAAQTPGALVFARNDRAEPVPAALVPSGETRRFDCEGGIPQGVLTTRDWCAFQRWSWRSERPRTAQGSEAPAWPDGELGDDGRETREEWILVDLGWKRGDHAGSKQLRLEASAWDQWPEGHTVPVRVDSEATFLGFPEPASPQ